MRYDYVCTPCGEVNTLQRRVEDRDSPAPCPACRENMNRNIVNRVAFTLKGKGWARDGYQGS